MQAYILTNDFHGTATKVLAREVLPGRIGLTYRQVRRAKRRLCGIQGCRCGGYAGERGRYYLEITRQGERAADTIYALMDSRERQY